MKIATAPTKERLLKLINEFYFTNNCIIGDNLEVKNTKLDKVLGIVKLENKRFTYYAN